MNDGYKFEEDIFDEEAAVQPKAKTGVNSDKMLRLIIIAVIAGLIILVVLITMLLGSGSDKDQDFQGESIADAGAAVTGDLVTVSGEESFTGTVPDTTEGYQPGSYTVNVGANGTLTLRKEATATSESILSIPNGTKLTITEVVFNSAAEEGLQYWGKTEYLGWNAWVCMTYLAKAYSGNVVTPGEVTTAPPDTPEQTTEAPSEEPTQEPTQEPTEPPALAENEYYVNVDPSLNMRAEPSTDSDKIASIPGGSTVKVLDTYENPDAQDVIVKVWAKIEYGGVTGWVAMYYLSK